MLTIGPLQMIRRLIVYVGVDEFNWIQENEQIITLQSTIDNTKRQCGCYPGSARVSDVTLLWCGVLLCGPSKGQDIKGKDPLYVSLSDQHP